MSDGNLEPGTLWPLARQRSAAALLSGALLPIDTSSRLVADGPVQFVVRVAGSLARKDEVRKALTGEGRDKGSKPNPFLPYDEELFVSDISETHLCLLNKFNVLDQHLLIVTRAFEDQELLLNLADFEALWLCLLEGDGLGFYNGGEAGGASQRHKHLQLIPLPFEPRLPGSLPIEPLIELAEAKPGALEPATLPGLPFAHGFLRLASNARDGPALGALGALAAYHSLMAAAGLMAPDANAPSKHFGPYNLLVTLDWMLLVPRSAEFFQSISVNAIGFAGGLLVRNADQLAMVERVGPMRVLKEVSLPPVRTR